jgi:hypothetical protein
MSLFDDPTHELPEVEHRRCDACEHVRPCAVYALPALGTLALCQACLWEGLQALEGPVIEPETE